MCKTCVIMRFKDGRCRYTSIVSSHRKFIPRQNFEINEVTKLWAMIFAPKAWLNQGASLVEPSRMFKNQGIPGKPGYP